MAFLSAYAECGTVTHAATAAGISRGSHYVWLGEPEYEAAYSLAHDYACQSLELEARRRAMAGWDEPVFHNGEVCGHKRKFSDALLMFLMKGAMPDKYRDNVKLEHAGAIGGNVTIRIVEDEDWYRNDAHARAAQAASTPTPDPAK